MKDMVNHPEHYNVHPSGVECIDIIEHMNFNCGSAIKYIWRADHKDNDIQDLEKALFCIKREIARRGKSKEEGLRESERREYSESDITTDTKRYVEKANYKKGSLLDSKHLL